MITLKNGKNIVEPLIEDIIDDNFSYPKYRANYDPESFGQYVDQYLYLSKEEIENKRNKQKESDEEKKQRELINTIYEEYIKKISNIQERYEQDLQNGKIKEDIYSEEMKKETIKYLKECLKIIKQNSENMTAQEMYDIYVIK